jgi:hypothetical protein
MEDLDPKMKLEDKLKASKKYLGKPDFYLLHNQESIRSESYGQDHIKKESRLATFQFDE